MFPASAFRPRLPLLRPAPSNTTSCVFLLYGSTAVYPCPDSLSEAAASRTTAGSPGQSGFERLARVLCFTGPHSTFPKASSAVRVVGTVIETCCPGRGFALRPGGRASAS